MEKVKASTKTQPKRQVAAYVAKTFGVNYIWAITQLKSYPNMMTPEEIGQFVEWVSAWNKR